METIPVRPEPNQTFQVVLHDQDCSLRIYARNMADGSEPLYMDLYVDEQPIFYGTLCKDALVLPLYDYMPFEGGLLFVDMNGAEDPQWSGLGTRWQLVYLTQAEVTAFNNGTLTFEE